eukprot:TRINITY_DN4161_c0_g1_i1.p1 TRINITY_DN4161_c0_g1~~TRINITY_DN4161_c0_g1_i1.p1  ORF type:complete len:144 (+),score=31.85 TRINITY_DN4161_c0_g1_i1:419-850(+)
MDFNKLPKLIVEEIISHLPKKKDIYNCCLVEKRWNSIVQDSKKIYKRIFMSLAIEKGIDIDKYLPLLHDFSSDWKFKGEPDYKRLLCLLHDGYINKSFHEKFTSKDTRLNTLCEGKRTTYYQAYHQSKKEITDKEKKDKIQAC